MKSLEQAIADECKKVDKKPEELTRLELDGKVKASNLEVRVLWMWIGSLC